MLYNSQNDSFSIDGVEPFSELGDNKRHFALVAMDADLSSLWHSFVSSDEDDYAAGNQHSNEDVLHYGDLSADENGVHLFLRLEGYDLFIAQSNGVSHEIMLLWELRKRSLARSPRYF